MELWVTQFYLTVLWTQCSSTCVLMPLLQTSVMYSFHVSYCKIFYHVSHSPWPWLYIFDLESKGFCFFHVDLATNDNYSKKKKKKSIFKSNDNHQYKTSLTTVCLSFVLFLFLNIKAQICA